MKMEDNNSTQVQLKVLKWQVVVVVVARSHY